MMGCDVTHLKGSKIKNENDRFQRIGHSRFALWTGKDSTLFL
ncbi:hypothetical protein SAMN05192534_10355 [Alteribacillus persepolensis]|uniref:Uncharacterized protein n=1 Tax=Alteribacillus persepolensis TaxID=568899 RepID=A0A1G8AX09_9BACI|nr:hypothetical protein SAMN05192534_10355 [Alteribacillus persepolensis]